MRCAIWYQMYNLKNVKNTHSEVLVTKSNAPPWVFFTLFKLYKWYQIMESITYKHFFSFRLMRKIKKGGNAIICDIENRKLNLGYILH